MAFVLRLYPITGHVQQRRVAVLTGGATIPSQEGFFFRILDQFGAGTVATIPEVTTNTNQPHPFIMSVVANMHYLHENIGEREVLLKYQS